jgi:hypothetical protein
MTQGRFGIDCVATHYNLTPSKRAMPHNRTEHMKTTELGYHKEYGLTDKIRIRVVRDAQEMPIKMAAQKNRVALSSVYKWRKRVEGAA